MSSTDAGSLSQQTSTTSNLSLSERYHLQPVYNTAQRLLKLHEEVDQLKSDLTDGNTKSLMDCRDAVEKEAQSYWQGMEELNAVKTSFHLDNIVSLVMKTLALMEKEGEMEELTKMLGAQIHEFGRAVVRDKAAEEDDEGSADEGSDVEEDGDDRNRESGDVEEDGNSNMDEGDGEKHREPEADEISNCAKALARM